MHPQPVVHPNRRRRLASVLAALIAASTTIVAVPAAPAAVAAEESAGPEPVPVEERLSLVVDDSLPRPDGAGAFAGPSGRPGLFVVGELVVHDDDRAVAEQLAERYGGAVVETVDRPEQLPEGTAATLIRFDPGKADTSTVLEDLTILAGDAAHGAHAVSDDAALATLAAAARARVEGIAVDLNWIAGFETIRTGSTTEAPAGPPGYNPDAFTWSQLTDLNVPAAWNLLARAGLLRPNSVPVGVVDRGFSPVDADRTAGISDPPTLGNGCGGTCPQHGANVASTAAAGVDNGFGGAGTGGPVARTVLIDVGGTLTAFAIQVAETRAIAGGARILNMSLSGSVPAISGVLIGGFNGFTANVRQSGVLQFAAAGNNAGPIATDVDSTSCFIGCWEADVFFPCELAGVVCVGGIVGGGTNTPAMGSNVGSGGLDPTATVELWGDFCTLVGPDLATTGNATHSVCGTSFATPAVAGVAALLWAANGNAGVVEATLLRTAVPGACSAPGNCAAAIPDARAGVAALLGNLPPDLSISATSATSVLRGTTVSFSASASDPDGPAPVVSWFVDGVATGATGVTFSSPFYGHTFGLHTVTAVASDGTWSVPDSQGGIVVSLANTAPTVRITAPADGATFTSFSGLARRCRFVGLAYVCPDDITLTAESADANINPSRLPDAAVTWHLDGSPTSFAMGHRAVLAASSLGLGTHTVTVRAIDDAGLGAQATITISIVRPTPVLWP